MVHPIESYFSEVCQTRNVQVMMGVGCSMGLIYSVAPLT